jgi:hypothetical protein
MQLAPMGLQCSFLGIVPQAKLRQVTGQRRYLMICHVVDGFCVGIVSALSIESGLLPRSSLEQSQAPHREAQTPVMSYLSGRVVRFHFNPDMSPLSITTDHQIQIAITGGASGIGLATAKLLATRGAILSLADANEVNLGAAVAQLPTTTSSTVLDVRDFGQVTSWISQIVREHGRLDGAANLAGVSGVGSLLKDETDELWDSVIAVKAKGVFNCLRAQLPCLTDKGSIVSLCPILHHGQRPQGY